MNTSGIKRLIGKVRANARKLPIKCELVGGVFLICSVHVM